MTVMMLISDRLFIERLLLKVQRLVTAIIERVRNNRKSIALGGSI
jgi:hypothetical protein